MAGITLDTGALIAIERRDRRISAGYATWLREGAAVAVPAVVIAEWWRGQKGPPARFLHLFAIEPTTRDVAVTAGEALAQLRLGKEHTIDGIVMASAASRGDVVYTSDYDDLARLGVCFPAVRILGV
jgi:predicted nucleic acid-binding protein